MTLGQKYNSIDLEKGTLESNIFTDESIYQDELEKIFGRAWLQISHTSLIPRPNDFFLSYMGEDPVIVTRDSKGEVHVFLNMCRHRGNRVVRADDGNAKNFMCTYHGWTFSNEGKLVSVPGLQEAYYGELDVENLSLVEAKSDTYAGVIFATWDPESPTLEAYLGDARYYLDLVFNRRDGGQIAYGPVKWSHPLNWKTPVDNCSDFYHTVVSHMSTSLVARRSPKGLTGFDTIATHKTLIETPGRHVSVNGHMVVVGKKDEGIPALVLGMTKENVDKFGSYLRSIQEEEVRRLGSYRANNLAPLTHSLFPNTILWFRQALPRGPLKTEFWHFTLVDNDAPQEIRDAQIAYGVFNGPAGIVEMDDQDNWIQVTNSGLTPQTRKIRHQLSMGVGHDRSDPESSGTEAQQFVSETNQRYFYARWQEFMNAESWADIHIDPITAQFEGTASMKS